MEEGAFLGGELADETVFGLEIKISGQGGGVGHLGAVEAPGKERTDASRTFQARSDTPYGAGDQRAVEPQPDEAVECVAGINLSGAGEHRGEHRGDGGGSMRQVGSGGKCGGQAFAGRMIRACGVDLCKSIVRLSPSSLPHVAPANQVGGALGDAAFGYWRSSSWNRRIASI